MEERVYTIPLRGVKRAPRWKRAKKAISDIRAYLMRHTKSENIKLDSSINEKIWERGAQKPPSRIRVRVTEEDGVVRAELVKEA
ncbi:MAG TPA: 50S ribosomal protein L31e [Candidatus Syntrophoarchaeum butanivorans]|uniref:Large ribosomal subunit protein eL31 n=1 Tax=Candidatus Syntropharchaeum butanivorans TaxID=1839936 RepID=A0A1F2P445_9EURY|nr:MAG: Ribosomal protein L31e [Candidatus Syntrophoarchaeum butanivorans]RJS72445.1 MAG: 50S ribosomal protein L31e [Candidatus Syntrophoarchaeum sp. WYZ-LMO15]HDM36204.1 50S ribosomal protein L31e [Candidatus Syntrophoarchaeum butanivorans]HEC57340.1 50S ribosomal protein L31e [Candidatus Syntrophoarchaeum butanivorans]